IPMEAQVSPLPRELTTPPVTKMCLVCLGAEEVVLATAVAPRRGPGGGKRDLGARPAGGRPSRTGAALVQYTQSPRGCQSQPARRPGLSRPDGPALPVSLDEPAVVVVGVDPERGPGDQADGHAAARRQGAELFELFEALQGGRRERRQAQEEVPAVG